MLLAQLPGGANEYLSTSHLDHIAEQLKPACTGAIWCARADGTMHGPYASFQRGGQPLECGHYADGKKHGLWTEWYENGQRRAVIEGKPGGNWAYWYPDGILWKSYVAWEESGERRGVSKSWYRNGARESEFNFLNGQPDGNWTSWDEVGNASKVEVYEKGKLLEVTEFRNGRPLSTLPEGKR